MYNNAANVLRALKCDCDTVFVRDSSNDQASRRVLAPLWPLTEAPAPAPGATPPAPSSAIPKPSTRTHILKPGKVYMTIPAEPARPGGVAGASDSRQPSAAEGRADPESAAPETPYFDVEELGEEERNFLVFLSYCSYLDWQDRFLDAYKESILNRAAEKGSSGPSDSFALYTSLRSAVRRQRDRVKAEDEEDDADLADGPEATVGDRSLVRQAFRLYRLDVYLRVMAVIFLLKLPAFCYPLASLLYLIYLFALAALTTLPPNWRLRNWRLGRLGRSLAVRIRDVYRNIVSSHFFDTRDPFPQDATPRAAPPSTPGGEPAAAADEADPTAQPPGREAPAEATSGAATVPSTPTPPAATARERGPAARRANKPSYFVKFMYQLFGAYLLSVFPWWEPNQLYLEESD
ncbi:ribonuclease HI [Babesia caballi]|uniref:Ribonuclease HI n=1 Tax=Babesia caballi TaxID=5871 RepID=A0AAV4M5L6_BABCB|nr:ribonuclease HI [Babesia caballi]